tara:strand:- start:358 stop:1335 length:978 start_codon:yes stop_codon:yes gene_type:complete
MHKCVNNTVGNVYHLEQMVDNFFPYSQKQLGFNKPATVVFQSDEDNASRMLGKTAYYNPESLEVVLYTDNRHPKDVMRSLSHELVHHAQNCRGDFTNSSSTYAGYAQEDPHLRKMEREAYTKGNLIFRDFEDLIKTGKINIEIDFSDSGEPKMSLKEWKDNEINTKLMKKWGLLKEEKNEPADVKRGDDELAGDGAGEDAAEELEEGAAYRDDDEEELEEGAFGFKSADEKRKELANRPEFSAGGTQEDDPGVDPPTAWALQKAEDEKLPKDTRTRTPVGRSHASGPVAGSRNVFSMGEGSRKISVREAKEITRRIIERVKKESK